MNRRNTENLVEDLLSNFEYQVQNPYIIYRNAAEEITGIWFYDPEECEEMARLFSRIHNAFSRASPKEIVSATKSDFEGLEVASSVASSEDTQEQPASSTMEPNDVGYNLLSDLLTAAACVGAPTRGTDPVQPNQSIRAVPSSRHATPSATSSQPPALHNLLPSRTSSATVVPPDAVSTSAPTNEPSNLAKQLLFPHIPIPFSQPTTADAAFASSAPPPLLPPLAIRQSAPLHQPFPLPFSSALPLHPHHRQHHQSAPLHQPFPLSSAPPLHPQHQQSASLVQLFPQSTAPPPLHPQHRQSDPLLQPFAQSTATPLHPQHQQSDPLLQPFPQSTAPPPLHPQHRQSGTLLHPFAPSTAPPPLHSQHRQSGTLLQSFPQSTAPPPPYGALLLQPFPPPKPSPLLAPTASPVPVLSRDKVRDALLRLVQNEDFIDMVYWEIVKAQQ